MRLRFTHTQIFAAIAIKAVVVLLMGWAEPWALSQEEEKNSAPTAEGASSPEEQEVAPSAETAPEKAEDLEVIDLNESLDEQQVDKWDSAKTAYPSAATPVTIENIVEPSSEYHYASFGKPNPFLAPQPKSESEMLETESTVSTPASDDSAISLSSIPAPAQGPAAVSGAMQEIPVVSTLQKYPLARLELKGVWQLDTGDRRAIVMTPNKEGVIVKMEDPIAAGKVLDIKRDRIVVRQYRIRDDGVREFSDENLYLGDAKRREKTFVRLLPGKEPEFTEEAKSPTTPVTPKAPVTPAATTTPKPPMPAAAPSTPTVAVPTAAPSTSTVAVPLAPTNGPLPNPVPFGTPAPIAPTNAPTTGLSKP